MRGAATPATRGVLAVTALAAAVLAPPLPLGGSLPDLRLEQVLALPLGAWLVLVTVRAQHRTAAARRWLLPFAPLMLASLLSIGWAAVVLKVPFSPRDPFEVAKLGIDAVLFGFALRAGRRTAATSPIVLAFLVTGTLSALIGLAQYLDLPWLVDATGGWWAPEHHLRALERDGRAFGTAGNPNYFGALMALVAVTALSGLFAGGRLLPLLALTAGTLGVVLSGSRGALGMLVVAAACAALLALRWGTSLRQAATGLALLTGVFAASVLFVEVLPRGRQDYLTRVAGAFSPTGDGGLALRLERWRTLIGRERPPAAALPGEPVSDTGRPPAPVIEGDLRAKAAVRAMAAAARRYHDRTGGYPPTLDVLTESDLAGQPPPDAVPIQYQRQAAGFTISAPLANPAEVDYPLFALGTAPNLLRNSSAEEGGSRPDGFRTIAGTEMERSERAALYGQWGISYTGGEAQLTHRAAVYQQRFLNVQTATPFTAAVWVRHDTPADGELFLYVNLYYTDGSRQDPYARVAADPSLLGIWQRLTLTITPDPAKRIDFLGVYLLSDRFRGEISADGFLLVEGSVPLSFTGLAEGEPAGVSAGSAGGFRRSPLLGVGPEKSANTAAVDNEYLLVLNRYGLLGLAAYLWLWLVIAGRALRAGKAAVAVVGGIAGLLLFNVVAGSLYQMQVMDVFSLLSGAVLAATQSLPPATTAAQTPSSPG